MVDVLVLGIHCAIVESEPAPATRKLLNQNHQSVTN
jgi:hypothetical protein